MGFVARTILEETQAQSDMFTKTELRPKAKWCPVSRPQTLYFSNVCDLIRWKTEPVTNADEINEVARFPLFYLSVSVCPAEINGPIWEFINEMKSKFAKAPAF